MNSFRIVSAGDAALTLEFEERIDPAINAQAIAVARAIHAAAIAGVRDVVPTFRTVTVFFDPLRTDCDALVARLELEAAHPAPAVPPGRDPLRIPVCYGGELGPDLAEVAAFGHLDDADVVRLHTARPYRVFMLGFLPGFAYLGLVDRQIAAPRRSSPRVRVPRGAVGIAGFQTAVYPAETPGGWQLIGRTPMRPFDPGRSEPFLMKAGDAVQFYSIDRREYDRLAARGESPASHRDGRGARPGPQRGSRAGEPLARRDDREYREYLREEQRRQPRGPRRGSRVGVEEGCLARRMQLDFHHGLLRADG